MKLHLEVDVPLGDGRALTLGRQSLVMGIVNVTPDSFSDGGDNRAVESALGTALRMVAAGAAIIDIGGESTRPGGEPVDADEELARVTPLLDALAENPVGALISIDTRKSEVARTALDRGADILNDVMGLQDDPVIAELAASAKVPVVAMHWDTARDTSKDVIGEMKRYFEKTAEIAQKAGMPERALILDPGFGFAKSLRDNYTILRRLPELAALGFPLLIGTSRKSMIGRILDNEPKERAAGTVATTVLGYMGGGHIFRVHDVKENADALRIAQATLYGP